MPEISAFVDKLRAAFGADAINELVQRGRAGEPVFFAVGTLPRSTSDISAPGVTEHALVPANPAALEARRSATRESPIESPTFPANPALHES